MTKIRELINYHIGFNDKEIDCITNKTHKILSWALVLSIIRKANDTFCLTRLITKWLFKLESSRLIFEIRAAIPTNNELESKVILYIPGAISKPLVIIIESIRKKIGTQLIQSEQKIFDNIPDIKNFTIYRFEVELDKKIMSLSWSINTFEDKLKNIFELNCNNDLCHGDLRKNLSIAIQFVLTAQKTSEIDEIYKRPGSPCDSLIID